MDSRNETGCEARRRLRREALQRREALSREERQRAALLMTERLLGHQWFYRSETILGFVGYGSEIPTWELLGEALRLGKKLYVAKVMDASEKSVMKFFRLTELSELKPGYKGIPEPPEGAGEYCFRPEEAERTLLLMPGVAFDGERNRLGYGRGFYDTFFADKKELCLRSLAVGFRCQRTEGPIPVREGDIRPCQVLLF